MLTNTEVSISFSDGVEQRVSVDDGQTVLDAGLAADLPLLYQCRTGSCGSCIARLETGEAEHRAGSSSSLSGAERADGYRLLCLTQPHGPCQFRLAYDSAAGAERPVKAKAFVNAIERIAEDVMRLELELADGHWFTFRPGQFVQVAVPGTQAVRSYSMASTVADLPRIELLIRILPGGAMSEWLCNQARTDDVLDISGPYGSFFLKDKIKAPHIMIAGGTGLAPMMAMIDTLRMAPGRKPKIILSFGCQSAAGLFHMDALALRTLWLPTLDLKVSVDRGPAPDDVRTGNPVEAVGNDNPLDRNSVAYLCGPPGMIDAARRHLESLGLDPANIFAEHFTASGA